MSRGKTKDRTPKELPRDCETKNPALPMAPLVSTSTMLEKNARLTRVKSPSAKKKTASASTAMP